MNAIVPAGNAIREPVVEDLGGQYLTFLMRGDVYAIALAHVREIIEFGTLTSVPRMPEFVRGVMNLRGSVLPVVDLGARMGLPPSEATRKTCVVILEVSGPSGTLLVGAMVDAVCEVSEVARSAIQEPPKFGSGIDERYVQGMVCIDDRFTILLDAQTALSFSEMARLADALKSQ